MTDINAYIYLAQAADSIKGAAIGRMSRARAALSEISIITGGGK